MDYGYIFVKPAETSFETLAKSVFQKGESAFGHQRKEIVYAP